MTVTGLIIERDKKNPGKVRIKFLGLPGETGPELLLTPEISGTLESTLHEFHATGEDQEVNYMLMKDVKRT